MVNDDRPEYQSRPEMRSHSSFPQFKTIGDKPKGPLEKALSFFADVRVGEAPGGTAAAWMGLQRGAHPERVRSLLRLYADR